MIGIEHVAYDRLLYETPRAGAVSALIKLDAPSLGRCLMLSIINGNFSIHYSFILFLVFLLTFLSKM